MKKNNYLPAVLCTLCTVACVLRTCIDVIEKSDEKSLTFCSTVIMLILMDI